MKYDPKARAAFKRLAKLGVVSIRPSAEGDRVFVTTKGAVRLNPPDGSPCSIKVNPSDRKYLRALQAASRTACADVRPTRLESGDTFRAESAEARAKREAAKARTREEVEQARARRDAKRAAASTRCAAARGKAKDARPLRPKRLASRSQPKGKRELAELRNQEARATLSPLELSAWERTGGGRRWTDSARKSGLESFREFAESENLADYAPEMPTDFAKEEAAWYAKRRANPSAPLTHAIHWAPWEGGRMRGYALIRWSNGSDHWAPAAVIHGQSRRNSEEQDPPYTVEVSTAGRVMEGRMWTGAPKPFPTLAKAQAWAAQEYKRHAK